MNFFDPKIQTTIKKSFELYGTKQKFNSINDLENFFLTKGIAFDQGFHIKPAPEQKALVFDALYYCITHNDLSEAEVLIILRELIILKINKHDVAAYIIQLILTSVKKNVKQDNWTLCDYLYQLKDFSFINEYITIASTKSLGSDRQMLFLLFGKMKDLKLLPVMLDNINDYSVNGHILSSLRYYPEKEVKSCFYQFQNDNRTWVRKVVNHYLRTVDSKGQNNN